MYVTHLSCSACAAYHTPNQLHNLCTQCGKPLLVHYDLERAAATLKKRQPSRSPCKPVALSRSCCPSSETTISSVWAKAGHRCCTPSRLGEQLGLPRLYIKDESCNPTGSFKARGMALAVSMAKELGVTKLAVPSAGNAAGALAAYAARAGLEAHIFMPADVPLANLLGVRTDRCPRQPC